MSPCREFEWKIELRKEPTPTALRVHNQGRSLQLLNSRFAVCHLPELNSMLAEWVFKLCKPELHLQYLSRESFAETDRYLAKTVVARGWASRALVQIAYAIGLADPVSFSVEIFGTERDGRRNIRENLLSEFDLRPGAMRSVTCKP